jgi:ubiquinone/menaquinone biosynthesis C-methylase UbiE
MRSDRVNSLRKVFSPDAIRVHFSLAKKRLNTVNPGLEDRMPVYQKFAHVYDKIGSDQFSKRMFRYTQRLLARLRYHPRSVLDLACGTGTAAVMWAETGLLTFGIDGSQQMLDVAERKARTSGVTVSYSRQPLTSFCVSQRVDLVTCYYDSVNYLLSLSDLTACFAGVRRALYDGGYFIFDVNTPEAMKVLWGSQVYADETDDVAWIWKNCYFPRLNRAEIRATFYVRHGDKWKRFEETHAERGYGVRDISKTLKAAGLKPVYLFDCLTFNRPDRRTLRLAVVAQK